MGKIIVKNIRGMGWKTRIGLIAMFTLVFSVLIYQVWYGVKQSEAAIVTQTPWTNVYHSATLPNGGTTASFAVAAGNNRMLVVAFENENSATSAALTTYTASYGGVAMTYAGGDATAANAQHTLLFYLKDNPVMDGTAKALSVTVAGGGTITMSNVWYAVYSGVDQSATPIETVQNYNNNANGTTSAFATALTVNANEQAVLVCGASRATAAVTWNAPANWTKANNQPTGTTGLGFVATRTIPATNSTDTASSTGITSSRVSMTGMSMKPAITTLATGADPAATTIAPGAAATDVNTFTLVTGSAGTTEAVTSVTVNLSTNSGIGRLAITNSTNTELGFTTTPVTGSNTITVSGLNVTGTVATFKVRVTPLPHSAMPAVPGASYAITAPVTAWAGGNIHAGSDTNATALTIDNLSPGNATSFTGTPGNNTVNLTWGLPADADYSQVLVLRNTAAISDTPAEGATYGVGSTIGTSVVRLASNATSLNDSTAVNGTTYYYKIFAVDTRGNYSAGVSAGPYTPVSPDAVAPTVDPGFAVTTPVNSTTVPITTNSFTATDNVGGSGVAGYLVTTTSAQPAAGAAGWTSTPPSNYTAAGQGSYTLYPWAKDGANNVSAVYNAPVTVVVDLTKPTVSAFTVSTPVASRNILIGSFTASDTGGSNMSAYMITTSSTPPAANDPGWSGSSPGAYTVASDGTFTLYPWAKDGAGNVSAAFGSPRTVQVDTAAPSGLSSVAPADESTAMPLTTALSCSTASDGTGVGGVLYYFSITSTGYSQNSGWIPGTSFSPPGLVQGKTYTWSVMAKDALGNTTASTTARTFTTTAPCVRNDPTLTLLTSGGGIATTIATDSGTSTYNMRLINNDTGDCGSTSFNLSITDTDLLNAFDDSKFDNNLTTKTITLLPNTEATTPVTVRATPGEDSGVERTIVTSAADPYHALSVTGFVQTTLNVVTCQPKTPLLIVGPDSGYLNRGGKMVYTITVKNTDSGAGCSPVIFNLSKVSESNSSDYDASQFSVPSLTLNSGELGSATFTATAKSTAAKDAVNSSIIGLTASGHTSPGNVTVTSKVNNPMLHNSDNTNSTKWSVSGGWGIPNGRYGEIDCNTCHVGGGGDTSNIKRINEKIFTPYTSSHQHFPGEGVPIAYRRYIGAQSAQPVMGWDNGATPRTNPTSTRICEGCHTYDAAGTNGVKAHPFSTTATLGSHFNTDGKDCTKCHKHNAGFSSKNMLCNSCHGDSNVATITAANRYVVAPPLSTTGITGTLTGNGQVSNNPKVGAHQTHLKFLNGFSSYSTVDFRCQGCHGPLPTDYTHGLTAGSSIPAFQALATNRGARTASFNAVNLTCSNTYCHNPAGTGGTLAAANAGAAVFPSWTSANYLNDTTRKSQTNCNRCHKVPGDAGFTFQSVHGSMTTDDSHDCSGCHGHNGDAAGRVGQRHMDGIRYGAGDCNTCHDYDTVGGLWGKSGTNYGGYSPVAEGWGAHAKHIDYIKTRLSLVTLDPTNQTFGTGVPAQVCGTCHTNIAQNHNMGGSTGDTTGRMINFGDGTFRIGGSNGTSFKLVSNPLYNGTSGTSSLTQGKTCSNISCHYLTTPLWSTY